MQVYLFPSYVDGAVVVLLLPGCFLLRSFVRNLGGISLSLLVSTYLFVVIIIHRPRAIRFDREHTNYTHRESGFAHSSNSSNSSYYNGTNTEYSRRYNRMPTEDELNEELRVMIFFSYHS